MEQQPGFASLWQNPKFQDMIIKLVATLQQASKDTQGHPGDKQAVDQQKVAAEVLEDIYVNKAVLASSSNYWLTRIERWDEQADTASIKDQSGKVLAVFEVPLCPEDLPVARAAVQYVYTHQPPDGIDQLMQAVRLADKWLMPGYITACLDKLAKTDAAVLTAQDINLIMSDDLSPGVLQHPGYEAVQQQCAKAVVRLFARPQQLYNSADGQGLADFRGLSLAALLLWAQQDELQVDSENTVAAMITDWWQRNISKTQSLDQKAQQECKQQLTSALRVQHLTTSVLTDVLRQLPWFMSEHAPRAVSLIQLVRQMNIKRQSSWKTTIPPNWLKGPRTSADQEFTYEWEVTKAQLQKLHEDARDGGKDLFAPKPFFWKGIRWEVGVCLTSQSSALQMLLQTESSATPLINPVVIAVKYEFKCVDANKATLSTKATTDWLEQEYHRLTDVDVLGVTATDAPRASSLPRTWLMPDGMLRLQVVMKALDEPA